MARPLAPLFLALLLAGCAAKGPGVPAKPAAGGAGPIAMGRNLIGEECRAVPVESGEGTAYSLFCGSWEQPSGGLSVTDLYDPLPKDKAAWERQVLLENSRTAWAGGLAQKAICQPPANQTGPQGHPVLVSHCQLREGGWPYLAVTLFDGRRMVQADGIPALAELMMDAGNRMKAEPVTGVAAGNDWSLALRAALGEGAISFGRGDLNAFERTSEVGRLSNSVEDYAGAEAAYRKALDIQTKALGPDSPGAGDTLMTLALEVSNQGRGPEADALFRRADALLQKSFDKAARARLGSYMAFHAANGGDARRALSLGRDSSAIRRAIVDDLEEQAGGGANRAVLGSLAAARGDLIHSLLLEATVSLRLEQYGLADAAAQEAATLFSRTRGLPPWWHARILGIQGLAKAGKGDAAGGAALMSKAVASNKQLFGAGWPVASSMLELGRVYAQAGMDDEALAIYREALGMLAGLDTERGQLPLDRLAPFLDVLYRRSQAQPDKRAEYHAEMFRALQAVREGVVGQTITRTAARFASTDPAVSDLIRRQQDGVRNRDRLRIEAAAETAKPDVQRDRAREEGLAKQLEAATADAQGLERQLQAAFPDYARLTKPAPVEPASLRARLREGQALVQFAFASGGSYGFILTKSKLIAYSVTIGRADLQDKVAELRRSITPRAGVLPPFDLDLSHDLYVRLFGGAGDALAGVEHLLLVPSAALASLPPALLVREKAQAGDYARASWLVRDMAVSVMPSVPAFLALSGAVTRPQAAKPFIGFAAPPFQGRDAGGLKALGEECRTDAALDPALLRALAPLPETAGEIGEIGRRLGATPADLLTGGAVTKAAVRAAGLEQYRIVYFATHGLLPGELRCQSQPGLALAPPDTPPASAADDGLLTASDIALLRLNADLVVLSACNTAGGDARLGGEALSGLAESFFFAGARGLLVSHWQVPSAPTVLLMTGLFAQDPGLDKAAALAAAQRSLASSPATAHPFNWAAFTLVGAAANPGNGA
ncbi:CHAT domain-containing tetratricopeptide repeat protein [Niveispirillum sp. KHB5.9]|uniref:CHAT domain-containing tetratricopeptide repeat protein n=1 Tax=Niveispirillum sp. KHB5.9 TaxID=3400269 RepID=UPI003A8B5054